MRRSSFLILGMMALAVTITALAGQMEGPAVSSASNPTPQLTPGGPGVVIDLRGTNLDRISSARVLQSGQPVGDVTITLGPASTTSRAVTLKALANAPVRAGLVIRISDGRQSIDIPAKIIQIAVGPAKPINTQGPVDTSPRLIDTTKTSSTGPVVMSVAINAGAASTASTRVTLNMSVQNAAYYRASENSAFTGASWQSWTITAVPPFDLSPGNGTKTVYVQVKNAAGTISPTASDTITLNAPARQQYTISGADAYTFSQTQGFKFSTKLENAATQEGYIRVDGSTLALYTTGKPFKVFGARCDFVLFDGRELKDGWTFVSYNARSEAGISTKSSYRVDERPMAGSRTVRFRIHLWTDPESWIFYVLQNLTLEGPANADWREAFR